MKSDSVATPRHNEFYQPIAAFVRKRCWEHGKRHLRPATHPARRSIRRGHHHAAKTQNGYYITLLLHISREKPVACPKTVCGSAALVPTLACGREWRAAQYCISRAGCLRAGATPTPETQASVKRTRPVSRRHSGRSPPCPGPARFLPPPRLQARGPRQRPHVHGRTTPPGKGPDAVAKRGRINVRTT